MAGRLIPCVGAVVRDERGRLLVVRRRNAPGLGRWSVPGGRVEPGEDDVTAVVREVAEETGLTVLPGALVGTVHRDAPGGGVYVIRDYACRVTGGSLTAGDDATDVRWVSAEELAALPVVPGLLASLEQWGVAPH